jgi:hypothetical protein
VPPAALRRLQPDPDALAALLRSGQVRRAPLGPEGLRAPGPAPLGTGLAALDALLGGGLHRGELCELLAPPSSGGTAVLRAALGAATRAGELCALVDPADALDPRGAALAGLDLRRLLWVRPGTLGHALRACELLLEARFALVALDLGNLEPPRPRPRTPQQRGVHLERLPQLGRLTPRDGALIERVPVTSSVHGGEPQERVQLVRKVEQPGPSPWARLSRKAERYRGVLLVLSRTPQAGSFAAATVELGRAQARWEGAPGTPGRLFTGASAQVSVARARHAPPSGPLRLVLPWVEPAMPEDQSAPGSAATRARGGWDY